MAAGATRDGLAVVGQQPASRGKDFGQINDFGGCNLDSILGQIRVLNWPTCFRRRRERESSCRFFNDAEPGAQLIRTAVNRSSTSFDVIYVTKLCES